MENLIKKFKENNEITVVEFKLLLDYYKIKIPKSLDCLVSLNINGVMKFNNENKKQWKVVYNTLKKVKKVSGIDE